MHTLFVVAEKRQKDITHSTDIRFRLTREIESKLYYCYTFIDAMRSLLLKWTSFSKVDFQVTHDNGLSARISTLLNVEMAKTGFRGVTSHQDQVCKVSQNEEQRKLWAYKLAMGTMALCSFLFLFFNSRTVDHNNRTRIETTKIQPIATSTHKQTYSQDAEKETHEEWQG